MTLAAWTHLRTRTSTQCCARHLQLITWLAQSDKEGRRAIEQRLLSAAQAADSGVAEKAQDWELKMVFGQFNNYTPK